MCICICMHVCMYIYIYIYIHRQGVARALGGVGREEAAGSF